MCGLAGTWNPTRPSTPEVLSRMAAALAHRGPDDQGVWQDAGAGIGLAHRRLSILDLSPAGHQPMASARGRYLIVFNGEIYNFAALRDALEAEHAAPAWRGHSDTEILLAGCEHWGVDETLRRANGMFAIALFDRAQRTLHLARDRMGEKPLYFGWVAGTFAFASELKAFEALPGWQPRIDTGVAALFLGAGFVGGPRALVRGLFRLPPGTRLALRESDLASTPDWPQLEARLTPFWSREDAARAARAAPPSSVDEADAQFDALLRDAVSLRMVADVPVGAFLSGGIDSSAVVAAMQQVSARPVRTFTIAFGGEARNEAPFAAAVARHLGTEHVELDVRAQDALDLVPQLPALYDEPFADDSQIPTVLLARLARRHVAVALSGDGGDELFAGYKRYRRMLALWAWSGRLPADARPALGWLTRGAARLCDPLGLDTRAGMRVRRAAARLEARSIEDLRLRFKPGAPGFGLAQATHGAAHCTPPDWLRDPLDRIVWGDQCDYLPDDILVKVDRAAMSCSLETRIPLLDPRIVDYAWSLPRAMVRGPQGTKLPLRRLLDRHVPRALIDRPKRGFGVPLGAWLRGPLRPWAEALLAPGALRADGLWDEQRVAAAWSAHRAGRGDHADALWNVLMLAAWQQRTGATV